MDDQLAPFSTRLGAPLRVTVGLGARHRVSKLRPLKLLGRFPRRGDLEPSLRRSLDSDDAKHAMGQGFTQFLGAVGVAVLEKSSADMEASLQAVGSG